MPFPCAIVDNDSSAAGGGAAPLGASYVVMAADGILPNERVLTAGAGISIVDGGAGGPVTISATAPASGWTDSGTVVHLTTVTDTVAIGAAAMSGTEKLRVVGTSRFEGGTPAGSADGIFSSLTGTIPLGATWRGVHLNYDGVDAGTNDGEFIGLDIDMSATVSGAPAMYGIRVVMPAVFTNAEEAMHLEGNGLSIDFIVSGFAALITGGIILTGTVLGGSGTAALPEYSFSVDSNTGMFRVGADTLGFSTGGVQRMSISTANNTFALVSLGPTGTAAAPTWSFSGDSDTGMYSSAANTVGITAGGTLRLQVSTTAVISSLQISNAVGTAAAPGYSFTADLNTGVFSPAADQVGISTGGVEKLRVTTDIIALSIAGTAAIPAIVQLSDQNTGIAWTAADTLVLSTGGVARLTIDSAGKVTIPGTLDPTDIILSGGGTAHFMQWGGGSTAAVGALGTMRLRYNEGTNTAQVSLNGAAYVDLGTGLTGGGVANEVAFWSGASSLTSDAGMTYTAAADRLTVGIVNVGTVNATPATGDIWRTASFLQFQSGGGLRTIVDAESVQTLTGQKTISNVIFDTNPPTLSAVPLAFSTPNSPTAGGQLGRSAGTLQWHDGSAVRGVLTDGQVQTVTGQKTFENVVFTTNPLSLSVAIAFGAATAPVAAGELGRSGANLQFHDGTSVKNVLLAGSSAAVQSAIFTFSHATGSASTGAVGFTPRAAILIGIITISGAGGGLDGTYNCTGVITGTGTGAKAIMVSTTNTALAIASDADAAAGVTATDAATTFSRELDVDAFGSSNITLTWSTNVSSFTGFLLVIGD